MLRGKQLGHPLIPASRCVRNDVEHRAAGARAADQRLEHVRQEHAAAHDRHQHGARDGRRAGARGDFELTPLQVGASIRINDSLHEGSSRFYAEITRLRQLLDLTERHPPLLFLLDELMQGTNSKDRRIGAEGVLRAFLERGAIGLISTHDLALTDIDRPAQHAYATCISKMSSSTASMKFDFKLRDGVVTKSNGVELMRSIGLKV